LLAKADVLSRRDLKPLLVLIIAVIVGIVAWVAVTAPNAKPLPPHRRLKEWGDDDALACHAASRHGHPAARDPAF
jgi:hypothetical protein